MKSASGTLGLAMRGLDLGESRQSAAPPLIEEHPGPPTVLAEGSWREGQGAPYGKMVKVNLEDREPS
jgi:hypothetical protein